MAALPTRLLITCFSRFSSAYTGGSPAGIALTKLIFFPAITLRNRSNTTETVMRTSTAEGWIVSSLRLIFSMSRISCTREDSLLEVSRIKERFCLWLAFSSSPVSSIFWERLMMP
ncbi:hypothetical protein D3C75_1202880 [compost metagenome]